MVIASNNGYAMGAVALARTLKAVGEVPAGVEYLCIVPRPNPDPVGISDAAVEWLQDAGYEVRYMKQAPAVAHSSFGGRNFSTGAPLKLQLWGLTEYARLLYLDSDSIAMRSVAALFEPQFWRGNVTTAFEVCSHSLISALMLVRPSQSVNDRLLDPAMLPTYHHDQQYLNDRFQDEWRAKPLSERLPTYARVGSAHCFVKYACVRQQLLLALQHGLIFDFQGPASKPWDWPEGVVPQCELMVQYAALWVGLLLAPDRATVRQLLRRFRPDKDNRPMLRPIARAALFGDRTPFHRRLDTEGDRNAYLRDDLGAESEGKEADEGEASIEPASAMEGGWARLAMLHDLVPMKFILSTQPSSSQVERMINAPVQQDAAAQDATPPGATRGGSGDGACECDDARLIAAQAASEPRWLELSMLRQRMAAQVKPEAVRSLEAAAAQLATENWGAPARKLAWKVAKAVLDEAPYSLQALSMSAALATLDGKHKVAVTYTEKALALEPEHIELNLSMARSLLKIESYASAVMYMRKVMRSSDPTSAHLRAEAASLLVQAREQQVGLLSKADVLAMP